MDVLKKINKMRLDRNWSIYRLSLESGIAQSTLTNMFNRETLPSITTLECLCHAFGISMSEFFSDDANRREAMDEKELIELYRTLNDDGKKGLTLILREIGKK